MMPPKAGPFPPPLLITSASEEPDQAGIHYKNILLNNLLALFR